MSREHAGLEPISEPEPHTEWGKARVISERPHLNPSKMDPQMDPRAIVEHQAIIDQIERADMPALMEIQKNIAEALEDRGDPKDKETIAKLEAVYRRSQVLLGVASEETKH